MAKFYGIVGYSIAKEDPDRPGIWTNDDIFEQAYYGDKIRITRGLTSQNAINDSFTLNHNISIIADEYAFKHYTSMKYAIVDGAKWKVSSVEVKRPRLILTLGGLYNGQTRRTSV